MKYKVGDVVKVKEVYYNGCHYNKIGIITDGATCGVDPYYYIIISGIEGKTCYVHESDIESKL